MTRTQRTTLTVGEDGRVVAIHVAEYPRHQCDGSRWLWGLKEIGDAINRNERWARRNVHKLPVVWVSGKPAIALADLVAWLKSQPTKSRPRGPLP